MFCQPRRDVCLLCLSPVGWLCKVLLRNSNPFKGTVCSENCLEEHISKAESKAEGLEFATNNVLFNLSHNLLVVHVASI